MEGFVTSNMRTNDFDVASAPTSEVIDSAMSPVWRTHESIRSASLLPVFLTGTGTEEELDGVDVYCSPESTIEGAHQAKIGTLVWSDTVIVF